MAEIRFLTNEPRKVEGLAYAGFETFRGSPYTSCARETGQNSRDAAIGGRPVKVHFNLRAIPRSEVPFADSLQHSIQCCLAAPQDAKTKQHLERALKSVSGAQIAVLEISDWNTTGLVGPTTDPRSIFAALVKGDGVTNKADETSAGSFGIGKNAAFAVSDLQTVIYSTCYLDVHTGERRFAAQGRLRLISHTDGAKELSAEGYWGNTGFAAIENSADVPHWIARDDIGTSILSVGFREQENWVERMTLSLATNFFLAIDRREIEFCVGGREFINQATLDGILSSNNLEQIAAVADQLEDLHRARRLLECIRSDASLHQPISIKGLGDFTLHLLVKEGMPREVHVLRNGIYIADNFARFSEPMRRFPGVREFTAVLEPAKEVEGSLPSALLKQLENPAHDAFEPERIVELRERESAKRQIKELIKRVREIIRSVAKIEDISNSHLDELSHLFGDAGNSGTKIAEEDPERYVYGSARKGRRAKPPGTPGKGTGKGARTGRRTGLGTRRRSTGQKPAVPLRDLRSVLPDSKDARKRSIFFTPDTDGEVEIAVSAAGLSGDVELAVAHSTNGSASNGRISVRLEKGVRFAVNVTFAEPFAGPIELTALPKSAGTAEVV